MYKFVERISQLYQDLQDDLSKKLFIAQLTYDLEPTWTNSMSIVMLRPLYSSLTTDERLQLTGSKKRIEELQKADKKVFIYGTGFSGKKLARDLLTEGLQFYGFCNTSRADAFSNGLMGKPVVDIEYLVHHREGCFIIFATGAAPKIIPILTERGFPSEHILFYCNSFAEIKTNQYLQFPELYHDNTAFIDCGCFDLQDSYDFAEWCNGRYSQIIALEPDPYNYAICLKRLGNSPLLNTKIIQSGLSSEIGSAIFGANGSAGSHIVGMPMDETPGVLKEQVAIPTTTIDEIRQIEVSGSPIGFIKMDIEGMELCALRGAKDTIVADKPLLAICVYHKRGDMIAIMDYLKEICPEYHFWLRNEGDLVLYASIDALLKS